MRIRVTYLIPVMVAGTGKHHLLHLDEQGLLTISHHFKITGGGVGKTQGTQTHKGRFSHGEPRHVLLIQHHGKSLFGILHLQFLPGGVHIDVDILIQLAVVQHAAFLELLGFPIIRSVIQIRVMNGHPAPEQRGQGSGFLHILFCLGLGRYAQAKKHQETN